MGDNGVLAATYVTDNPAIQMLIESSRPFRGGRVFLYGEPVKLNDTQPCQRACDTPTTDKSQSYESEDRGTHQESTSYDGGRLDDYV